MWRLPREMFPDSAQLTFPGPPNSVSSHTQSLVWKGRTADTDVGWMGTDGLESQGGEGVSNKGLLLEGRQCGEGGDPRCLTHRKSTPTWNLGPPGQLWVQGAPT